jgi:cyclase
MNRTFVVRISAATLLLAGAWFAYTEKAYTQNNAKQAPPLMIHKIQNDLYWIEGDGGNVAVYVTGDGVILVDDKYVADYDQIVANVKSVTNQPIKYILSTHHHADHSGGNTKFASTVEIISTVNAHNNIVNKKQSNAPDGMVPARVTFTQEEDLFLGGKQVRAIYAGRGHTNGDAVIYFPDLRVLHTGDLMAGTTPLIDYPGGGSLAEWPKTLDEAMKLDFDTVIPGHGQVTNKAGLKTYRDNVEKEITRVRGLIREGKSQDDVAKVMTAEYGWMPGSLNMQWSLPGMMTELK